MTTFDTPVQPEWGESLLLARGTYLGDPGDFRLDTNSVDLLAGVFADASGLKLVPAEVRLTDSTGFSWTRPPVPDPLSPPPPVVDPLPPAVDPLPPPDFDPSLDPPPPDALNGPGDPVLPPPPDLDPPPDFDVIPADPGSPVAPDDPGVFVRPIPGTVFFFDRPDRDYSEITWLELWPGEFVRNFDQLYTPGEIVDGDGVYLLSAAAFTTSDAAVFRDVAGSFVATGTSSAEFAHANPGATPEPATVALMTLAVAGLAGILCRRR